MNVGEDILDTIAFSISGTPKVKALTGYLILRIILGAMTVHSGIIFAGILTQQALEVTDCADNSSTENGSCLASDNDDEGDGSEHNCRRLFGIIKPESLLTAIATGGAIVLAISATLVGTAMDVTPFRRQIGIFGTSMCTLGVLVCIAIVEPSEGTIAVCSVGMFLHFVFKDIHGIVIESYGPELSHKLSEVSTAITAGAGAFYIFTILTLVIWVGIGMVLSPITYGTTISVVTGVMMMIFTYMGYSRLPNVPAANELPPDTSLVTYTFIRFKALAVQVYHEFPDLGVVLLSSMVVEPALAALFVAAVLILVVKYYFSADQVGIILGCGMIGAMVGVLLSRWIASSTLLDAWVRCAESCSSGKSKSNSNCNSNSVLGNERNSDSNVHSCNSCNIMRYHNASQDDVELIAKASGKSAVVDTKTMSAANFISAQATVEEDEAVTSTVIVDEQREVDTAGKSEIHEYEHLIDVSSGADIDAVGIDAAASASESCVRVQQPVKDCHAVNTRLSAASPDVAGDDMDPTITGDMNAIEGEAMDPSRVDTDGCKSSLPRSHAIKIKYSIIVGYIALILITIVGLFAMQPCALAIACFFVFLWGMMIGYSYNAVNMIKAVLVPGGSEAEFAGLSYATGSIFQWLPLLVFTFASEIGSLDAAIYSLNGFYFVGAIIIGFVDIDRALVAKHHTLHRRRWAVSVEQVETTMVTAQAE